MPFSVWIAAVKKGETTLKAQRVIGIVTALLVLVMLLAIPQVGASPGDWNVQQVPPQGLPVGWSARAMAVDTQCKPHIFTFGGDSYAAYYSRLTDTGWLPWEAPCPQTGSGWNGEMVLDSAGNPRVLHYSDRGGSPDYGLNYAERVGPNNWVNTKISTYFWTGKCNALKLDANDNPHIVYTHVDGRLIYCERIGGSWSYKTVENIGFRDQWNWVDLALDASGNPHLVYTNNNTGYLRYAKWTGATWEFSNIEYLGGPDPWFRTFPSIGIDTSGKPNVCYLDVHGTTAYVKFARWDGSTWNTEIVEDTFRDGDLSAPSMAIDSEDCVHLAYGSPAGIRYAVKDSPGASWVIDVVDTRPGYTLLALDKNDAPHIIFSAFDFSVSEFRGVYYAKKATVTSIAPNSLGNGKGNKSAPVTIYGFNFVPGSKTKVQLIQSGVAKPKKKAAKNVVVFDANTITCNLNLTSAIPGTYDVVVTNKDKKTGTLTGGLTVTPHPVVTKPTTPFSGKIGTSPVSLTLNGSNYQADATVKLTKGSFPDIPITNVVVSADGTTLTCDLDLTGAHLGAYKGVVTNPDNGIGEFKFLGIK